MQIRYNANAAIYAEITRLQFVTSASGSLHESPQAGIAHRIARRPAPDPLQRHRAA